MNKKQFIKKLIFTLNILLLFLLVGCNEDNSGYKDVIDRPTDIPTLVENNFAVYPEKPSSIAKVDNTKSPIALDAVASKNSTYNITKGETTLIEYQEIDNWSYVYIPIENYHEEYGNMKITAKGNGAERIAIQALYYEMYDENNPPVAVYLGDIVDGEQYFIFSFNQFRTINKNYIPNEDSDLSKMTIIGICLFIDSNPSQMKVSNKSGSLEIISIKFLKNDDEELKDRYVVPSVAPDFFDSGYGITKDPETGYITINREAGTTYWSKAHLAIQNYSSDYSAFNLKFNTTGVQNIYIALQFSVEGHNWLDSVDIYRLAVDDGSHEAFIDFSAAQPIDIDNGYDYAAGYYVKNYRINCIQIYLDTYVQDYVPDFDATCVITELKFERTASEGTTISKGWNAGTPSIQLGDDIIAGGTGTITYQWHSDWYYLTMPVLNYETADKLTIQFEAKNGIDYFGVAVVAGGREVVLRSAWLPLNGSNSEIEDKAGTIEGLIEEVKYSKATKIYTITFDFTDLIKLENYENKSVNELAITALRFYFTDPNGGNFDGDRVIHFISVQFEKNE